MLTADEQARIGRLKFPVLRRRAIHARALLRMTLGSARNEEAEAVELRVSSAGKPHCPGGPAFNIAHCGERFVIAIGSAPSIGVDIEVFAPLEDLENLAKHVLSDHEHRQFSRFAPAQRLAAFYRAWTRKESLLKAVGEGLYLPLDQFSVDLDADTKQAFIESRLENVSVEDWQILPVPSADDEAISVAIAAY